MNRIIFRPSNHDRGNVKFKVRFKSIFILLPSLLLISCGLVERAIEPHVTTSVDASVSNSGSDSLSASAIVSQIIDDNHCKPGQVQSSPVELRPGQSSGVSASMECNTKVRTFVRVVKNTSYNVGFITPNWRDLIAILKPGVQFRLTDRNHQNGLTIRIVSENPTTGHYDHFWSLAPGNAKQVGWASTFENSSASDDGLLYFSIPKNLSSEMYYIEFDENLGITNWAGYQVEHVNGVYRSHFDQEDGPSINSKMSHGSLICDDFGCNEVE